jgi:hypothetical protein
MTLCETNANTVSEFNFKYVCNIFISKYYLFLFFIGLLEGGPTLIVFTFGRSVPKVHHDVYIMCQKHGGR